PMRLRKPLECRGKKQGKERRKGQVLSFKQLFLVTIIQYMYKHVFISTGFPPQSMLSELNSMSFMS
uniref:Uncharacterized protein n=1 Tax=Amphimedon queenslandica TaxID=400682 RepID=A0A1X7VIB9_AMPQE